MPTGDTKKSIKRRRTGKTKTGAYTSWRGMMERCSNPAHASYHLYGGRGISVCDRWHDADLFIEDMGKRPEGYSIDRVDPDGNYEPENCRWIPCNEQALTTRHFLRVGPCSNCGDGRGNRKGLCHACNEYQRRNGYHRPIDPRKREVFRRSKQGLSNSKPVRQEALDGSLIARYSSVKDAAATVGVTPSAIVCCLKGKSLTSAGFIWKYE